MFIYFVNTKHEKRRISPSYQPQLSERYQLRENLRTISIFRKSAMYMGAFNLLSMLSCTVRVFNVSPLLLNASYEAFDLSFAL